MVQISIIVPVYNTESYLEECILSLTRQTLTDIEIFLINDASTDNSLAIMKKYALLDSRIKVISLEKNSGVGLTRNLGLYQAKGEYIAFVDSDDFVKTDMFEKLYQQAISEKAEIVLCDTDSYSSNGKKKSVWYKPIYGKPQLKDIYHNTQPTSRIFSKKLIDRIHFEFLSGMGEGIIFELMINAQKITTVPEKLYVYRSREGSLSTTPNPRVNKESIKNNKILGERNPKYQDYFTFKTIEELLQLVANSVKIGDYNIYKDTVNQLHKMHYLSNHYIRTFYKKEYPRLRYIIKVYVLPSSYLIARLIYRLSH